MSGEKVAPGGLPAPFAQGQPLGSALYFQVTPERLFRREPRFAFERGERGLSWRDLILPEHALRGAPPRALGGER
jgi:hypothetical protein